MKSGVLMTTSGVGKLAEAKRGGRIGNLLFHNHYLYFGVQSDIY